jgi:hypothetical protein
MERAHGRHERRPVARRVEDLAGETAGLLPVLAFLEVERGLGASPRSPRDEPPPAFLDPTRAAQTLTASI